MKIRLAFPSPVPWIALISTLGSLAHADDLVIENVTVIDMTQEESDDALKSDQTVLISGSRIVRVDDTSAFDLSDRKGLQRVDGQGRFLVPGFWDMHGHVNIPEEARERFMFPMLLAHGVTGVRDLASDSWTESGSRRPIGVMREIQTRIEAGELLGPRLVALSSPIVRGPQNNGGYPPAHPEFWQPSNEEQGRQLARYLAERGADFIKTYNSVPRQAFMGLVDEGLKLGLYVSGHLPRAVDPVVASNAGMRTIEHARWPAMACGPGYDELVDDLAAWASSEADYPRDAMRAYQLQLVEAFDEDRCLDILISLAENGTYLVPTHTTRKMDAFASDPEYREDPRRRFIPRVLLGRWNADLGGYANETEEMKTFYQEFFELGLRVTGLAHESGVGVLVGTDTPDTQCFPGSSYHDEMGHLLQAGMSPFAILKAATIEAARFLSKEDRFGTVAEGMAADLVILDRNPIESIENSRSIHAVVFDGKILDRERLDTMLKAVEAYASG